MKKDHGHYIYSPSDLIVFMESEFASWMNRYHLDFPDKFKPDEDDESHKILQAKGMQHEKAFVQRLSAEGKNVCNVETRSDAPETTLALMREGADVIYQAALQHDDFAGYADFLVQAEGPSRLGDYHYEVWDTKLALKPKPYFLIQLCCYAEMLEHIQGKRPPVVRVVLGNGEARSFRTDDYFYFYLQLKNAFLAQQRSFNPNNRPEPDGMADHGRWTTLAEQILEETDHLSRVANIRRVAIKKLQKAGIPTMTDLARSEVDHVKNMLPSTLTTLRAQARLQVESAGMERPKYELIAPGPDNPRRGLALLPPASDLDVFFDMEGYPHVEGGLEYLFGAAYLERGELQFRDWWAHDRIAERKAFQDFIDWVHGRWRNDPSMHVYHYAPYEVSAMRRLMGRYGTREREVDELLRNEVFVDLYSIVRHAMRVGEPKYSIKNIEHLYKERRRGDVATALDSIVFYERWLETRDGDDWQTSKILADIRSYNKEDCESTYQLAEWLRNVQREHGPRWISPAVKEVRRSEKASARNAAAQLAQQLLDTLPEDPNQASRRALQELLAYLLEFHWREARPVFWAMFDRHDMTEEQLIDDIDCLGGLERTTTPPLQVKQSTVYEFKFDPFQDTKLHEGKDCYYAHDLNMKVTIQSLDAEKGFIRLRLGPGKPAPPQRLSLIPDEFVDASTIAQSIYRTVEHWTATGYLRPALKDFLLRRRPNINGNASGPIIAPGEDLLAGAIDAVVNLNNSTLCIQGPPGSGKTFTAAHAIVALLQRNKTVGVSSNSHKAILKLMGEVAKVARQKGVALKAAKIGGDRDDPLLQNTAFQYWGTAKDLFLGGAAAFNLIGGTAWAFSIPEAVDTLDYLFVDEAGQVSVANLVGMAPSTNSIVLIGDQMQLAQPIQGAHPGESGKSLLEYLLQDHQTIPEDFGIFLGTSWRMHPDVLSFISGAVYEDRLHAEPHTANRVLLLPEMPRWIHRQAGILFIPVEHEGNTQGSDEEAEVIDQLVRELLQCRVQDREGKTVRPITLDDILLVAPYNMQVRKLQRLLPGAKVGSVDKFQGQEAAVVIVSMCASSNEGNARGLEFLFSKNRLNVAISRAQTQAIVVASPALACARISNIEQMELANLFCRIVQTGARE